MDTAHIYIDVELAEDIASKTKDHNLVSSDTLDVLCQQIVKTTNLQESKSCTLRFVGESESRFLNKTYRGKDSATNVLSFPSDLPHFVESNFIGDLAVCVDIVKSECEQQNKRFADHLLHLILHGILHLLGYDHISEEDAETMEACEIAILDTLGIDDPYKLQ